MQLAFYHKKDNPLIIYIIPEVVRVNDHKKIAIELAKALIQNSHVTPRFNHTRNNDIGDENTIEYLIGDSRYTFLDIVSHYLDNIERIKKWN